MSPLARQLVDFLRTRPPQSAREACAFLGVSQPVFSRLVASLGTQVLTLGKARRTRYAARREIPGVGDRCVLYEIDAAGSSRRAATLHAVGAGGFVVESEVAEIQSAHFQDLPYFLDGMRPAGFLGRRVPKQHPDLDLPADVRHWSADHCLRYLARWGWNTPGAFVIGDEAFRLYLKHAKAPPVVVPMARRRHEYPRLAHAALEGAPPGSSAGGEQPKFLVHRAPGPVEVLVKFSPPADDPTTRRHADLLVAEHLAHRVLQAHGRRACRSELVFADGRVFLEVERFDRLPAGGRRGVLSLFALDAEFAGRMKSWSDSAETLASQAVIDQAALGEVQWLELFGGLIANSDMHPANLSFFATGARPEELAPAYDMLPMRYSPRDGQQLRVDFEPPLPSPRDAPHFADARIVACELWRRVAKHDAVSDDFRAIAAQNEAKLAALAGLEKKLPKAQRPVARTLGGSHASPGVRARDSGDLSMVSAAGDFLGTETGAAAAETSEVIPCSAQSGAGRATSGVPVVSECRFSILILTRSARPRVERSRCIPRMPSHSRDDARHEAFSRATTSALVRWSKRAPGVSSEARKTHGMREA